MRCAIGCALAVALSTRSAAAEPEPERPPNPPLERAGRLYHEGKFADARDALLEAQRLQPGSPEILYALGQVEFNLKNYERAIEYQEKYLATNPEPAQAALAHQAIGAARAAQQAERRARERPPDVVEITHPWHREWDGIDTLLAATGGVVGLAGGATLVYARNQTTDASGTLADYDARVRRAKTLRSIGIGGVAVGGAAVIGALVRWRLRRVESPVVVQPVTGGATISLVRSF